MVVVRVHVQQALEARARFVLVSGLAVRQPEGVDCAHVGARIRDTPPHHALVLALGHGTPELVAGLDRALEVQHAVVTVPQTQSHEQVGLDATRVGVDGEVGRERLAENGVVPVHLGDVEVRRASEGERVGPRRVRIDGITSVWYRRAIHPAPPSGLTAPKRALVAGEMHHLVGGLVHDSRVTWVNPIEKVRAAEHKLLQLRLARELGLSITRTVVSADPKVLRRFASDNPADTICKPIYHGLFNDGGRRMSVLTTRVAAADLEAEHVQACPVLLQEEIGRAADVRATFIGEDAYVAEISGIGEAVDWRDPTLRVSYAASTLPVAVEARCRMLLARLGLLYGAFDLIRTPDGRHVFIEVNRTGEWAWQEGALGFPMRDAFVRLLYADQAITWGHSHSSVRGGRRVDGVPAEPAEADRGRIQASEPAAPSTLPTAALADVAERLDAVIAAFRGRTESAAVAKSDARVTMLEAQPAASTQMPSISAPATPPRTRRVLPVHCRGDAQAGGQRSSRRTGWVTLAMWFVRTLLDNPGGRWRGRGRAAPGPQRSSLRRPPCWGPRGG